MIAEHDVAVKVRDGCTLYCDIYRPCSSEGNGATKVPAIVAWSPFGKKHTGIDMMSKVSQSHCLVPIHRLTCCRSNGAVAFPKVALVDLNALKGQIQQNIALEDSRLSTSMREVRETQMGTLSSWENKKARTGMTL